MRRGALSSALILMLVGMPGAAWSEEAEGLSSEAGIGAVSALTTLIYGPVKIAYATLGLVIGGAAWGLSGGDQVVFDSVITAAIRGDYVVTPEHIRMERGLEFYGQDPSYRNREVQHASAGKTPSQVAAPPEASFYEEDY
jgi:hypothetical protein